MQFKWSLWQISSWRGAGLAAIICVLGLLSSPLLAADDDEQAVITKIQALIADANFEAALQESQSAEQTFPDNSVLASLAATAYYQMKNYGEAEIRLRRLLSLQESPKQRALLTAIEQRYEQLTANRKMAVIVLQKESEAGNIATAIAVGKTAITRFPDDELLFTSYGRALLDARRLEEADEALRTALRINPKNVEARKLIEEIRATTEAQTSEEMAEWISIAKDKVGDFIVTFLALFAAFITSSLLSPVALRIKLNRARRAFSKGNYDDFTDLIEGLLDEENFVPLRANFRFMLAQKSYTDAQEILNKYVNTLERLPTLLRILERENEKLREAE
jgi:tetratricopeptide (TPR) repeat protein